MAGERQERGRGRKRIGRSYYIGPSHLWGQTGVTRDEVCDIAENDRTGDGGSRGRL